MQPQELERLPGHVLLHLARNESASKEVRKAAVQILMDNNLKERNHPELAALVLEIKAERNALNEVEAIVESAVSENDDSKGSPFKASFTTKEMFNDETVNV